MGGAAGLDEELLDGVVGDACGERVAHALDVLWACVVVGVERYFGQSRGLDGLDQYGTGPQPFGVEGELAQDGEHERILRAGQEHVCEHLGREADEGVQQVQRREGGKMFPCFGPERTCVRLEGPQVGPATHSVGESVGGIEGEGGRLQLEGTQSGTVARQVREDVKQDRIWSGFQEALRVFYEIVVVCPAL